MCIRDRQKGKQVRYAYNEPEMCQMSAEMGQGTKVSRYKGLGEMNPCLLYTSGRVKSKMGHPGKVDAQEHKVKIAYAGDLVRAEHTGKHVRRGFDRVDDVVLRCV